MQKITLVFLGLMFGAIISLAISDAFAKYESGSEDAQSMVAYGKASNGKIYAISVDADGIIQTK